MPLRPNTAEHQRDAARRPRLRKPGVPPVIREALEGTPITDAQWEQIKYRIDATRLESAQLELAREQRKLVTKQEALDLAQGVCLRWVSGVETLSTRVRVRLDPSLGDRVASIIDEEVTRLRSELSAGPADIPATNDDC